MYRKLRAPISRRQPCCSMPWGWLTSPRWIGWMRRPLPRWNMQPRCSPNWARRAAIAREMACYPLHPRLSRLVVEARRRGVAEDGCTVAALLSAGERLPTERRQTTPSDLLVLMESPWEPRTAQTVRQVRRMVDPPRQRGARRRGAADFGAGGVSRSRGAPPAGCGITTGRRRTGAACTIEHRDHRGVSGRRGGRGPPRSESAAGAHRQRHPARLAARSLSRPCPRDRARRNGIALPNEWKA